MQNTRNLNLTPSALNSLIDNLDEIQYQQQEAIQLLLYQQKDINNRAYPTLLESPYASPDPHTKAIYHTYALLAARLLTKHGHNPLASHLYYTQFLDDEKTEERHLGFLLSYNALGEITRSSIVASDFGISKGMYNTINHSNGTWKPIYYLQLFPNTTQQEIIKILEPANYTQALEYRIDEIQRIITNHFTEKHPTEDKHTLIPLDRFLITEEQARSIPYTITPPEYIKSVTHYSLP